MRNEAEQRVRLAKANELIVYIGTHGRRFYWHNGRAGRLELDERGRVWFHDAWKGTRVYTHYEGRWAGFSEGGTLKDVIKRLRDYVKRGQQLHPLAFGPWPQYICNGDLWGYGPDMEPVRAKARQLGILPDLEKQLAAERYAAAKRGIG